MSHLSVLVCCVLLTSSAIWVTTEAEEDACCFPKQMSFYLHQEIDDNDIPFSKATRQLITGAVDYAAGRLAVNITVFTGDTFTAKTHTTMVYMDYSSSTIYIVKNNICTEKHTTMKMQSRCMLQSEAVRQRDTSTMGASHGVVLNTVRFSFDLSGATVAGDSNEDRRYEGVIRVAERCTPISEVIRVKSDSANTATLSTMQFYNTTLTVREDAFQLPAQCNRADPEVASLMFSSSVDQSTLPDVAVDVLRMFAYSEVFSGDEVTLKRPLVVDEQGIFV